MSLTKRILLIAATAIVVLAIGGMSVYKFVIVPKYIEPVLNSASEMLKDSEIQDTITDIAHDLADKGVIDNETLKNYMRKAKKYTASSRITGGSTMDDLTEQVTQSGARIDTTSDNKSNIINSQKSSLGITEVKSLDEEDTENAKINQSYSQKFSEDNVYSLEAAIEEEEYTLDEAVTDKQKADLGLDEAVETTRANKLYDKIMKAMSAHERAVFFSVIGKADTSKLISLYQTSNRSGAKEYLQSILDNSEYNEAVEIFFKYAPLLLED